jgi:hypothetical protein
MEEGGHEFELSDVDTDSSENESGHGLESGSPSPTQSKRSSIKGNGTTTSSQTPTLKLEFDNGSTHSIGLGIATPNVLDRQGLVVRTESREHLAPTATHGSRSRTVSPTRGHRKSPMLSPLEDE